MTFTYDLATDIGLIRLELDDVEAGAGVRPTGANFTDEELQVWLTREGSVFGAAAAACEALARAWSRIASQSVGGRSEQAGAVAEEWRKRAGELRQRSGGGPAVFAIGTTRDDAYTDLAEYEA